MNKNLTPHKAYELVVKKAKAEGVTVSRYAEDRGIGRSLISQWKHKKVETLRLDVLVALGILE